MKIQLIDTEIEMLPSSCNLPPGRKGGIRVGMATWLLIGGQWYRWDGGRAAHKPVTEASCLSMGEFLKYFADDLVAWEGD